jgi:predicted Na+-dependent transporter
LLRLFSLPIFAGILLGVLFPYQSLSLIWVSSLLLFLLLFLNTLAVDKDKILALSRADLTPLLVTQGLIFVFLPLVTTALAALVVHDPDFVFGVAVSSLAPCALVNPFFARVRGAHVESTLWNVVISTLICPLATVPMLQLLGLNTVFIESRFLWLYLLALTTLPVALSFAIAYAVPSTGPRVRPWLPTVNSFLLAALMFILVGSSLNRVPLRLLLNSDFFVLLGLFLVIDFGVFALARTAARLFLSPAPAESLALSVATRNFAVSASLMLFFHPKAALPSAIGLVVHSLYFQFLVTQPGKVPETASTSL